MESQLRTKLSSDFILTKLACIAAIIFLLSSIYNAGDAINFKKHLEHKLSLALFVVFLILSFIQPNIYYDPKSLQIKKLWKKEIVVPLGNIRSIKASFATWWTSYFTFEYFNDGELESVTINNNADSKSIAAFISFVKKINPELEVNI